MSIEMNVKKRDAQGTGASRRLRRADQVPAIIYGGDKPATPITLDHNEIFHALRKEAFHASVLTLNVEGTKETVLLRDTQMHAYKLQVLHVDFQRVDATHKLHTKVPFHFVNADAAPGVKLQGGIVSHVMNELDVQCLPSQLPEFIEVDLSGLSVGQSIHVSQIKLPAGVEALTHGTDPVVATLTLPRGAKSDEAAAEGGEEK
ncbi:MAG: 50S ribosomal protein L25/general stress protein Ctc [Methyloversatilis sp.]|jgi:large subunit ribosomal protein L25|uniref:Large ribosomal subunit protein bL25 n=1 Tax=Methyloversatilis universalis (strain ATCC BAA-1314 / DSM 25237 / JCM 13912 / CCUG 52030 / FAM5) TaxID=1000565 RepID=F5RHL2_METUF|nr:50S ribosomal protein L25/general stress protein Ctc [Methyloversatilis universalis]EGK69844.1 50S ribosomal protein L25 [Methyloversatilis universalis FAM5]MCP4635868.1 50S ribosomal protein L25/general stress protein Ctc [Methyloversatilis sp.]